MDPVLAIISLVSLLLAVRLLIVVHVYRTDGPELYEVRRILPLTVTDGRVTFAIGWSNVLLVYAAHDRVYVTTWRIPTTAPTEEKMKGPTMRFSQKYPPSPWGSPPSMRSTTSSLWSPETQDDANLDDFVSLTPDS